MRTRQIRALGLCVLLTFTLSSMPAMAAPGRDDGGVGHFPGLAKLFKSVVRFVLAPLDELGLPHP